MTQTIKPLGLRLNNPFNIRYSKSNNWVGKISMLVRDNQTDKAKEFEQFISIYMGLRAGCKLIKAYVGRKKLDTIRKIIGVFAPSHENPTDIYAETVSKRSGIGIDEVIYWGDTERIMCICREIVRFEQGGKFSAQNPNIIVFVGMGDNGANLVLDNEDFREHLK